MSVELKNTMSSLLQEVNEIKEQEDLQAKLDSLYWCGSRIFDHVYKW